MAGAASGAGACFLSCPWREGVDLAGSGGEKSMSGDEEERLVEVHASTVALRMPTNGNPIVLNLVPDYLLLLIGHVVMDWRELEFDFDKLMHVLLAMSAEPLPDRLPSSLKEKRKLFQSLVGSQLSDAPMLVGQLLRISDELWECAKIRNLIVHGNAYLDFPNSEFRFEKLRKGQLSSVMLTRDRFEILCSRMAELKGAFVRLGYDDIGIDDCEMPVLRRLQKKYLEMYPFF